MITFSLIGPRDRLPFHLFRKSARGCGLNTSFPYDDASARKLIADFGATLDPQMIKAAEIAAHCEKNGNNREILPTLQLPSKTMKGEMQCLGLFCGK